ncbi:MAG: UvrD-helicase domain-containing protein [Bacteroidales bacterium]|nr:UvrD-helicase domain-containing protein [Bacteroidales bacterium]
MYEILLLNDLNPGKLRKQFDKTLEELASGNFTAAEVKKMTGTGFYRARLDKENRLLFSFGRHQEKNYLLVLELILNHNYAGSRFLHGATIDQSKLVPLSDTTPPAEDVVAMQYVNQRYPKFHLLNKFLSFDDTQEEILNYPLPQIIIGSAGSGKTAITLERMKTLKGRILYVTLSSYLAENSARWYYSNNYENETQEIDFLSYREFIETIRIPEGKEMDFRSFERWFFGFRQSTRLRDAHKVYEEFRGVITGMDITKEYLSADEYLSLGVKQSIFLAAERETVYHLFEKYLHFLKEEGFYDINIYTHNLLDFCHPVYDYIIVDEVQDLTNIQLFLILKSLTKTGNFILCGDANQVVHPNFFSWSHLKTMFYQQDFKGDDIRILHANYRNTEVVSNLANRLLKIKIARFGSLDKESNYLVNTVSQSEGEMVFLEEKHKMVTELAAKTRKSVNYAVLVLRNEDKARAGSIFPSPLLFSVQESKGLEYENIILYNFISDNAAEFNSICEGVNAEHMNGEDPVYSRGRDKSDKSIDAYKFYINSLYVGITRAVKNVYIVEQTRGHKLIHLLGVSEEMRERVIKEDISSAEDWKREARRLEKMGKSEQADAIRKNILVTATPNWEPMTNEKYIALRNEAFDPEHFNKKAKDQLFDFALIHNQTYILEKLAALNYRRAEKYENERGSIFRRYYQYYRDDNLKMVAQEVNKYGIDYRDIFNFTPLHAAAYAGAEKITASLLENGANPDLPDTFHKTPVQISLQQAYISKEYASHRLRKIYPLLLSDALSLQVDGQLIKIDPHKIEYLMVHLFIAVQSSIIQSKNFYESYGIRVDDFLNNLKPFPESVLPAYRKKREYWLALLAKHETGSRNPYNKKLFRRIERGVYVLNPGMLIRYRDTWTPVKDIIDSQGITLKELKEHSKEKQRKEMEAWSKKYEKEKKKREREEELRRQGYGYYRDPFL